MSRRKKPLLNPDTVDLLKHIGTGVLVISIVALLIVSVWYGTRIAPLNIVNVEVEGGQTISHDEVKKVAFRQLDGEHLGIVPKTFAWTYPEEVIASELSKIPRIHDISVIRNSGTDIAITFEEYLPEALWCSDHDSDKCLFLDGKGFAFAESPKLSGGSFLRFEQIGKTSVLNENVSSEESFEKLLELYSLLSDRGWFVSVFELDTAGDAFLELVEGGDLKITLRQTPEETVDNLFVVLASQEFSHLEPGNFQYIDLRYGNKVFVNEKAVVSNETTASTSLSTDLQ